MARRIIIKTKTDDKMTFVQPLLTEDTYENIGIKTPLYGPPELTIEGDFEFEVEELRDYVQIEFVSTLTGRKSNTLYTYIDPGLNLKVGDLVDVPSRFGENNLAIVRALGADDEPLADFIVKEVTARYAKIEKDDGVYDGPFENTDYVCGCGDEECLG